MEECRKLSRYMLYLMVACPSLLPLEDSSVAMLEQWQRQDKIWLNDSLEELVSSLRLDKETLEEIKEVWIRLIIYAASKSRPEQHAAQLARGGELLTFVWLLMLRHEIGDCALHRMELAPRQAGGRGYFKVIYVADPHEVSPEHEIDDRNTVI